MDEPSRESASTEKQSILIVEDDKFLHKILVSKFQKEGFDVRGAMDGEGAIQELMTFSPSVILLDIILPKMNGFEVLWEIKSNPKTADIPVVILSNLSQEEDRRRAAEIGALDFLVKADTSINDVVARVKDKYIKYLSQKH